MCIYQYAPNPLVLNPKCRKTTKQHDKASDLHALKPNTKEWEEAVAALRKDDRGYIRVKKCADAKKLLKRSTWEHGCKGNVFVQEKEI
nr:hypothetical protein [Cronobacter dublinensis]